MLWKITAAAVMLSLVLVLAACSGQTSAAAPNAPAFGVTPSLAKVPAETHIQATDPMNGPTSASATAAEPAGPIKAKEITASVTDDTVTFPLNLVQGNWNSHFMLDTPLGKMGFMAYLFDDNIYVRASICPPCHGKTYTLDGNKLVCDVCATTFSAQTGRGIAGACINYPKAAVQYAIVGGNIIMKMGDLETAYQTTLKYQR